MQIYDFLAIFRHFCWPENQWYLLFLVKLYFWQFFCILGIVLARKLAIFVNFPSKIVVFNNFPSNPGNRPFYQKENDIVDPGPKKVQLSCTKCDKTYTDSSNLKRQFMKKQFMTKFVINAINVNSLQNIAHIWRIMWSTFMKRYHILWYV